MLGIERKVDRLASERFINPVRRFGFLVKKLMRFGLL